MMIERKTMSVYEKDMRLKQLAKHHQHLLLQGDDSASYQGDNADDSNDLFFAADGLLPHNHSRKLLMGRHAPVSMISK